VVFPPQHTQNNFPLSCCLSCPRSCNSCPQLAPLLGRPGRGSQLVAASRGLWQALGCGVPHVFLGRCFLPSVHRRHCDRALRGPPGAFCRALAGRRSRPSCTCSAGDSSPCPPGFSRVFSSGPSDFAFYLGLCQSWVLTSPRISSASGEGERPFAAGSAEVVPGEAGAWGARSRGSRAAGSSGGRCCPPGCVTVLRWKLLRLGP